MFFADPFISIEILATIACSAAVSSFGTVKTKNLVNIDKQHTVKILPCSPRQFQVCAHQCCLSLNYPCDRQIGELPYFWNEKDPTTIWSSPSVNVNLDDVPRVAGARCFIFGRLGYQNHFIGIYVSQRGSRLRSPVASIN